MLPMLLMLRTIAAGLRKGGVSELFWGVKISLKNIVDQNVGTGTLAPRRASYLVISKEGRLGCTSTMLLKANSTSR